MYYTNTSKAFAAQPRLAIVTNTLYHCVGPRRAAIYYYLLVAITMYRYSLLFTTIYYYLLLLATIYYSLLLFTIYHFYYTLYHCVGPRRAELVGILSSIAQYHFAGSYA